METGLKYVEYSLVKGRKDTQRNGSAKLLGKDELIEQLKTEAIVFCIVVGVLLLCGGVIWLASLSGGK